LVGEVNELNGLVLTSAAMCAPLSAGRGVRAASAAASSAASRAVDLEDSGRRTFTDAVTSTRVGTVTALDDEGPSLACTHLPLSAAAILRGSRFSADARPSRRFYRKPEFSMAGVLA